MSEQTEPAAAPVEVSEEFARQLVDRARTEGVKLIGPGGLLSGITKTVLETALEAELTEHLGYEANDYAGRNGLNSRNGKRSKTVLTDVGVGAREKPRSVLTGIRGGCSWWLAGGEAS